MLCSLIILMSFFFIRIRRPPRSTRTDTLFPDTTLFRSSASDGQQVDPRSMERAARVPDAGPIDARIVGAWEVWIPGSVYYTTDGLRIAQHYRSEEHTSELQSLMRISYAVFCLKKKKNINKPTTQNINNQIHIPSKT